MQNQGWPDKKIYIYKSRPSLFCHLKNFLMQQQPENFQVIFQIHSKMANIKTLRKREKNCN